MLRGMLLVVLVLAAGPAPCQTADPAPPGPARESPQPSRLHRFELGFSYGIAAITGRHGDVAWYDGAPMSGRMDLETSPTLGAVLAWAASGHVRFGVRAARQASRLNVTDDAGATTRTDLVLLQLLLEWELAFGGGDVQPVLTLGGGGSHARAEDGSGDSWHGTGVAGIGMRAAVDSRWALRALVRFPLLWVNGDLVWQVEPAAGVAFLF